jgi:hypothetical protein
MAAVELKETLAVIRFSLKQKLKIFCRAGTARRSMDLCAVICRAVPDLRCYL